MDSTLDRLARRQHGLVTTTQLSRLGWSRGHIQHELRSDRLLVVRRSVLRTAGAPVTREQAWLAAVLASALAVVLSHLSAAMLWGLRGFPEPDAIDLLAAGEVRARMPGVRGHRTESLPADHTTVYRSIPVTTVERTLVDVCGAVSARTLRSAVNDGLRRSLVTVPRLARTVDEVPTSGRRKIVPMVEVLRLLVPGYDAGDSDPEVDLVELLVSAGLLRPQQQVKVLAEGHVHYIDVGWLSVRCGFEYDSEEFHGSLDAMHEDRARLRRLKRAGWDIWPVTSRTTRNEIVAIARLAFGQIRAA
ncbi:MAG: hypothetical protein QOF60_2634 [Actinomycetota bacterium]|jgi:hypothetical protein|nr:hypothetical protein [Actinomycetota bacterium]